jgi:hypothetical protein
LALRLIYANIQYLYINERPSKSIHIFKTVYEREGSAKEISGEGVEIKINFVFDDLNDKPSFHLDTTFSMG